MRRAALPAFARTTKTSSNKGCFYLTELLNNPQSTDVTIARQVGVNQVITGGGLSRVRKEQYVETLQKVKESFAAVGMKIAGMEGHPVPFEKIKLGWTAATRRSRTPSGPSRR